MPLFSVERIEELTICGPAVRDGRELMSPFVWELDDGRFGLMLRVVENPDDPAATTSTIWYGESGDGLRFAKDDQAAIVPDYAGLDARGCEDPTVVVHEGETLVFYTGVEADGGGHLLLASGVDARHLAKRGTAVHSFGDQVNVKEAEVAIVDGKWTVAYEYAEQESSRIGVAEGNGPCGPWRQAKYGFAARTGRWDGWYLSTGPAVLAEPHYPMMFYNGATHDAVWGIGWIVFDERTKRVAARCEEPIIGPPGEIDGRNMAFAASVLHREGRLHLYLSYNDRSLHRAIITWDEAARTELGLR